MQVKYNILTNIVFQHKYFSHQQLECLTVLPSKTTERFMLNNGMIFKSFNNGFTLLYETDKNGLEKNKEVLLSDDLILRFYLFLTDANFYNYTESGFENITSSLYYFHNIIEKRKNPFSPSLLHQKEFVSESDILPLEEQEEQYFRKPFALIDIRLNNNLLSEYALSFKEKQTYWRYLLMSEHLKELQKPAILSNQIIFNGPITKKLSNKREVICFESNKPISLNQVPINHFKLVENFENETSSFRVVIKLLPTPDINNISSIEDSQEKNKIKYSEIFIY